jgi:hypothetical protein
MMRTMAPSDFGGRLCLNCARTTPELPVVEFRQQCCSCTDFLANIVFSS